MKKDAETYGYTLSIRDRNLSVDAGAHADARLIQQAEKAGIRS